MLLTLSLLELGLSGCAAGSECGNGTIEAGEECDDGNRNAGDACSPDCRLEVPPGCGNGVLEVGEECEPPDGADCDSTCRLVAAGCGDGTCATVENPLNCPRDCAVCGDGICSFGVEDETSCPLDCVGCGDGVCRGGVEDAASCPEDCVFCGDGICSTGMEDDTTCPGDCAGCGDGVCSIGVEYVSSCAVDCAECNDGVCSSGIEDLATCPADCAVCGDGECTAGVEDADSCQADCTTPGVPCGSIVCEPRAPECSWEGIDRIVYDTACLTPDTDPVCAYPATRESCSYACVGGVCVDPACTDTLGTARVDACGNGIDEDCDGSDCTCSTGTNSGIYYKDVSLYPGLLLDRDRLDLWTLAADHPGYQITDTVIVHNLSGRDVDFCVNGSNWRTLSANASEYISSEARWGDPGIVSFVCLECTPKDLTVGFFDPPEPHGRFVGSYQSGSGESYAATLEVQVIPMSRLGGSIPPPTSLRECLCVSPCGLCIDMTLSLDLPGGWTWHSDPLQETYPYLMWDGSTGILEVSFGGSFPGPGGSVSGPPGRLEGYVHDSSDGDPSGDLILHQE